MTLPRLRRVAAAVVRAPVAGRTWRSVAYVLLSLLLAAPAFALPLLAVVFGALSLLTVGLPFLAAVLLLARGAVGYFRRPARWLLGWDWPTPAPLPGRSILDRGRALLTDGPAWRALAYCFLKLPLAFVTAYVTVLAVGGGLYLLTMPVWGRVDPDGLGVLDVEAGGERWYVVADGVLLLLLFPWLVRLLVWLDRLLATALLAPGAAAERIARLEAGRAALTADAATTLRRVERDLHDGTQARLVSVGMALSRVERRLGRLATDDPGEVALVGEITGLVGSARDSVADALTELREIVRSIHPPALDEGLATALTTLASRTGLPVEVGIALDEPPPDDLATAVYFAAAELLTNAARHAGATRVRLDVTGDRRRLRLAVVDDGRGGAAPRPGGTGLAGLARRAEALDGRLDVRSPPGGPTTITMTLPRG